MEILNEHMGSIITFYLCSNIGVAVGNVGRTQPEEITGKVKAIDDSGGIEVDDEGTIHVLNWAYVIRYMVQT